MSQGKGSKINTLLAEAIANLRAVATDDRAAREKAYLKSDLEFLGATVPQIHAQAKAALRRCGKLDRTELRELTEFCWASRLHEHRSLACSLLQSQARCLTTEDLAWMGDALAGS